ncbi:MAG: MipA/OmpV family protein [Caulobacteraceae bacterium]|nr:MipA/OmpV family protein [Caulobacteraceae bacterium]
MIHRTRGLHAALGLTTFALGVMAFGTAAHAQSDEPGHLLLLGAGVYATSNPYESALEEVEGGVLPLFVYQNRYLTADLSGLAVTAFDNGRFKLEGRVSPRLQLVDPKDTRDFAFLERDAGVDVGARLSATAGPATLSVEYLLDALDESGGQEVNADLSVSFSPAERLSIEVAAGLSWKDDALATWLYGLGEDEVGRLRAYEFGRSPSAPSGGAFVPSLGVQMRYQIGERLYLIAAAEVESYNDDITDSPLMAKGWTTAGFVSLVRRF